MFFEPLPAESEPARRRLPEIPAWWGPPELEQGAVVAVERVIARSANAVIVIPTIHAFATGCLFAVEVVCRQGTLPADEWWDLQTSGHPNHPHRPRDGEPLPAKLLRLGVRYADGAKATTVQNAGTALPPSADPPTSPVLSWVPGGGGGGRRGDGAFAFDHFGLWLWPLPPAEKLEFSVEWPFAGIGLTTAELDGAAIVSAAQRSARYWPQSPPPPDPAATTGEAR